MFEGWESLVKSQYNRPATVSEFVDSTLGEWNRVVIDFEVANRDVAATFES